MNNDTIAILDNNQVLSELCGANDQNLVLIEELMGVPIYTRGNEIHLESGDIILQRKFSLLIDELSKHITVGQAILPELIRSLYETIDTPNEDVEELRKVFIPIPQGNMRIYPRNFNQLRFIEGMDKKDMIFAIGPAGTGKTFLAVAHALGEVLSKKKKKLVLTRPVVEAGESLGFLPGDLTQKLNPYLKPLYDAMEYLIPYEQISRLEENHIIEIAPLAYMRGRSLRDSYVILDEAQNTTREQMKMFLTRLGEDSKAIINGDITQIDLPNPKNSGLIHATKILSNIKEIHFTRFVSKDVVRSALVKKIIDAYEHSNNSER